MNNKKQKWQPHEGRIPDREDNELDKLREEFELLDNAEDLPLPEDRIDRALKESGLDPQMTRSFARRIIEQEQIPNIPGRGLERTDAIRQYLRQAIDRLIAAGVHKEVISQVAHGLISDLIKEAHKERTAHAEQNTAANLGEQ